MKADTSKQENVKTILTALLFFIVVYRIPASQGQTRISFQVLMEVCLSLGLATVLWEYNKYIAGFLILSVISMHYPLYNGPSFYAGKMIFLGCFWYYLVVSIKPSLEDVSFAMCSGAVINLIIQCLQVVEVYSGMAFAIPCEPSTGLMSNPNETAFLYVVCIPAFMMGKWYQTSKFSVGLPIMGVYLCYTDLGWVCVGVALMMYLWHNKSKRWAYWSFIGIGLFGVFVLLFKPFPTLNDRINLWKLTFPVLKQRWFFGCGLGHWQGLARQIVPITGTWWQTAHNEFYQVWAEMGVLPLVLILGYYIDVLRRYKREFILSLTAIVIISVFSLASFNWHIAPLAMISLTWAGVLELQLRGDYEKVNIGVR